MGSYWVENTRKTNYQPIDEDVTVDVCIIGGGITGIATAYMLKNRDSDLKIAVLEADRIGMGVTANTTAKITSQHGLIYDYLYKSFGEKMAKGYLDSNEEAIDTIKGIIKDEGISCDFSTQDAYVYTCEEKNNERIKAEVEALNKLGFEAEYLIKTPLPFDVQSAIKFQNQAQFNPRKYLLSLTEILDDRGVGIYENSKVEDIIHRDDVYEISANGHKINCKYLIMTSHYPIKNFPGMYFIKMYQESSYVVAIETEKEIFDGMYISCDTPATSFRNVVQDDGKKLLLVGGGQHKTGATNVNIEDIYVNIENYIKSIYPDARVKYKWMTEDCVSLDKIPYIGEFSKFLPNMYVATGFKKWGMTTSHVAAKIISDKILEEDNVYENIYTATRLEPIKNGKEFGNMLRQSTYSLAINKLKAPIIDYTELNNNSGGVVNYKGKKLGIYKDETGELHAVIPFCKHLGCELSWNNLEKTWDCPCHGSRYDFNGKIITEPTVEGLDVVKLE